MALARLETQITAFGGDYRDLNGRPGGKYEVALVAGCRIRLLA